MRRTTAAKSPNLQRRRRLVDSVGDAHSTRTAVRASSSSSSSPDDAPLPPPPPAAASGDRKRVVILGGTGRVGASTAAQLAKGPGGELLDLVLVGKPEGGAETSPSSFSLSSASPAVAAACKKYPVLSKAIFQVATVDSGDARRLEELFRGAACVIHCAGPFQSGGAGAAAETAAAASEKEGGNGKAAVPAPLAAAIRAKVPYVDVCDDPDWAKVRERERRFFMLCFLFERERERGNERVFRSKQKKSKIKNQKKSTNQLALSADADARAAGVPAITTAGVFPGLSGLMASHMCAVARLEAAPLGVRVAPGDDGGEAAAGARARAKARAAASEVSSSPSSSPSSSSPPPSSSSSASSSSSVLTTTETSIPDDAVPSDPSRLRYSYFVAGSGGAGPAVLAATLLLAARDAAAWKDGVKVTRPAFSEPLPADFGRFVGNKTVYLIDLPEVEAAAVDLRVPSVSARFATAPGVFNLGTVLLARLIPKSVLGDRKFAAGAASLLSPLVAAADAAMGGVLPVAIRVDLELKKKTGEEGASGGGGGKPPKRDPRDRRRDDPFLRADDEQASSSAFVHRDMATAVGACTAAFARELLRFQSGSSSGSGNGSGSGRGGGKDSAPPAGVSRPEALPPSSRERILRDVAEHSGAARFEVGAPPWALDSEPTRLGEYVFFFFFFFFFRLFGRAGPEEERKNSRSRSLLLFLSLSLSFKTGMGMYW